MGNIFSIQLSCESTISRCWDCVAGQAAFVCMLEENLEALQTELTELKDLKDDVTRRVRIAEEQQQLQRLHQVDGWLTRADSLITESDRLIAEIPQQINKLCMGGCCSKHPISSHKFGKLIAKQLQEVKEQKNKGVFSMVAEKVPLPTVTELPSEPTVGLESTFNQVWRCLQEGQVRIIGLYGLGGVGKTTLLNRINNEFLDAPHDFDYVLWVVVSQHHQIEKVQEDIGERIGFSDEAWKQKSVDEKAIEILRVFRKKKFALLLDDIWERVDLTRIGVPLPTQENGAKVVFTTRSIEVCSHMGAHKIKVECLPKREALQLFEEKVGPEILHWTADIHKLAEAVVDECAGLPLALITIARAMASKKTPKEWQYAVDVLKSSVAADFPEVGKEMYPKLKFSYDCLPNENVKSCFLYCSLYPEDYPFKKDRIIDYWIGEGFLDQHSNYSSIQNKGHYIVRSLVDACLLEEEEDDSVKMHDVIRDMALWIARGHEDEKFLVQAGFQLKEPPVAEKWENVRRMSLMKNQIRNLNEILVCPNLQTLFLGENSLGVISNDFFNYMPMLRVLDLSENIGLEVLPVGIAKLISLEHLNLSMTSIRKLPVELKALEKLKYLNLESTLELRMIPQQLIHSFSKLQVLKMFCCGCEWSVEEIEHLNDLEVLTISFKSSFMLERALGSSIFKRCNLKDVSLEGFRGSSVLNILGLANLRHLYQLQISFCHVLEEVNMEVTSIASAGCFHSLRFVYLSNCSKLRDASWIIFALHLETLLIWDCQDLEEIMSDEKLDEVGELMVNSNLFSKLQVLNLRYLPKLKTIYKDVLPLPRLKKIEIYDCPMLKKLPLNPDSAKGQKIVIKGGKKWWDNLEWEDEASGIAFFPSFKPLY